MKIEYENRIQLWNDLVHGHMDRLFIPTQQLQALGQKLPLDIYIKDPGLRFIIRGKVVGLREKSLRFPAGAFLTFSEDEMLKSRRILGLQDADPDQSHARQTVRVHMEVPVNFTAPPLGSVCLTKNISEKGLFILGKADLRTGQQVSLELLLDDEQDPFPLEAEVAWVMPEQDIAGLKLSYLSRESAHRLKEMIMRTRAAQKSGRRGPEPILVADNDMDLVNFISRALTKHGYEIVQAASGQEALKLIRSLHPSLVLIDVLMPDMDGTEICKTMRADASLTAIPVILISALESEHLLRVSDESGATDFLKKPLDMSELIDMVGYYLQQTRSS